MTALGFALSLAGIFHSPGAAIVNPYHTSVLLHDKIATARALHLAGLPVPASYIAPHPGALVPLLDAGPLIVKPHRGASGHGVRLARTPADLAAVEVERNEPVVAQRYHPTEGRDRKMYCIGGRVFGVLKVFPARTEAEKHGVPDAPLHLANYFRAAAAP